MPWHVPEHASTTDRASGYRCVPLWATSLPPFVHATGFQHVFIGVYVAGGHDAAPTHALQLQCPFGVLHHYTRHLCHPRAPTSQAATAPPPSVRVIMSTHDIRHGVGFFLAYFEHHRRAFSGTLHGHFW
jgi:hypothetical protein